MKLSPLRLGIFGSGQLGRMFTQSASRMGYPVFCYSPEKNSPCKKAGATEFVYEYLDKEKVFLFLDSVDSVSFEFENIPEPTLDFIDEYVSQKRKIFIAPSTKIIRISQDRLKEKNHFRSIGLKTTNYIPILPNTSIEKIDPNFRFPAILKTNRFGYDGKGQWKVSDLTELKKILSNLDPWDHILEERVEFERELSIVLSRFPSGKILYYPASENIHKNHILDISIHPAKNSENIQAKALDYAKKLAVSLDYVGVFALEFFQVGEDLICNEFAPRPHNSGHFSMDGSDYSQFELQVLSLIGIEPGLEWLHSEPVIMKNIVGTRFFENPRYLKQVLENPDCKLHLYEKEEARSGRKMGHINFRGNFNFETLDF